MEFVILVHLNWSPEPVSCIQRGRRGCDGMVVGFTTICAIRLTYKLKLWIRIPLMVRCTQYNIMW